MVSGNSLKLPVAFLNLSSINSCRVLFRAAGGCAYLEALIKPCLGSGSLEVLFPSWGLWEKQAAMAES